MTVTREDLNPCTVKLTVVADPQEVDSAFDKALKKISKEINIPGFRPGHAPKSMIEPRIDPARLAEDAADLLVRATFQKAIEGEGLQPDPGTRPSVSLESIDRQGKAATYAAKVPLPPQIELGEYKGVEIDAPDLTVTDEEIQYQIDELRKRKGTREVVTDRGLQEGDNAVVNIKIEGAEGDGKNFLAVVGRTFPQLDEAITGMSAEEIKSVELTFPEGFGDAAWANTTHRVHLAVNSASTVKMPELSDDFAKEFQAENVESLKSRMRESLTMAKGNLGREMMQEQILEKLRATSTIHVSDNMWEALAQQRLTEIAQEQDKQGKNLEQYAQENGMSFEELIDSWNEQAKIHVERAMVVRNVFEREGLQVTNSDLNTELVFMSQEYSMQPQELLTALQGNNALPELQFRAISRKVTDFLLENATMSGAPAEAASAEAEDAAEEAAPVVSETSPAVPEEATPVEASDSPESAGGEAPVEAADATEAPESEGGDETKAPSQS